MCNVCLQLRASQSWKSGSCEKELEVLTGLWKKNWTIALHICQKKQAGRKITEGGTTWTELEAADGQVCNAIISEFLNRHFQWTGGKKKKTTNRNKPARDEKRDPCNAKSFLPCSNKVYGPFLILLTIFKLLFLFKSSLQLASCWKLCLICLSQVSRVEREMC